MRPHRVLSGRRSPGISLARWRMSWALIFLLVFVSIAPSVSRALAATDSERGVIWLDMCAPGSMPLAIAVDSAPGSDPVAPEGWDDHCTYCRFALEKAAFGHDSVGVSDVYRSGPSIRTSFLDPPRSNVPIWFVPPTRAPPAFH